MKCVYANWHDGNPPCCTHDCGGCVWCDEDEAKEGERVMEATLWPYGKCKKCANKNYCAWSESEILNCMNNGCQNFSPMRNADRIRAMTDEKLAEWLVIVEQRILEVKPMLERPALYADWLNWLKQEVQSEQEKRC